MTSKQKLAAAAAILAAAVAWITWPKIFVLAAIIAVIWFGLACVAAAIVARVIAYRDSQVSK